MIRNYLFINLFLFLAFLISCGEELGDSVEDTLPANTEASEGVMEIPEGVIVADINGEPWQSHSVDGLIGNRYISLLGISADVSIMTIDVKSEGLGTYQFEPDNRQDPGAYGTFNPSNSNEEFRSTGPVVDDLGGSITISELNTEEGYVSGFFEFKAYAFNEVSQRDSIIDITNGRFNKIFLRENFSTTGTFQAKIDGDLFEADHIESAISSKLGLTFLQSATNKAIYLQIPLDIQNGTYDLMGLSSMYAATYSDDGSTESLYESESGILTITKHDIVNRIIEGTIEFEAYSVIYGATDTKSVSEGSFTVTYL